MFFFYLVMSLSLSFSHLSQSPRFTRAHKEMNVSFYFSLALSQFLYLSLYFFLSLSICIYLAQVKEGEE